MKKPNFNFLLFFVITLGICQVCYSQNIEFKEVIPDGGGDFDSVTGITQDEDGFIWFSTKKGLFKYDGNKLTNFVNDPLNSNSLSGDLLLCIHADKNGIIWVGGLRNGLDRFDTKTGSFTHYKPDPKKSTSIANDTINAILRDRYGKLWIATQQGLDQFDEAKGQFIHFKSVRNDPTTISDRQVRSLYEDKQGILWIGTGSPFLNNGGGPMDGGLNRYNRESGTFTRYEHNSENNQSLISNKIKALYEDNQGIFWVGTAKGGIHQMNRKDGTFKRILYNPAHPEKFSVPPIVNEEPGRPEIIELITQDASGGYWVGTKRSGAFYYNPKVGKMVHLMGPGTTIANGIGVRTAFTSHDGIFWIGTDQGNLYRVDLVHKKIQNTLVATAPVAQYYEQKNGTIWIGTAHDVIRIDKNGVSKRFSSELNFLNDGTDPNYSIYVIKNDLLGNVWIGGSSGLYEWNTKNQTFTGYQNNPKKGSSLSDNVVFSILEDSKKNFWVGTLRGLNLLDRKTGKFTHFWVNKKDTISNNQNLIASIIEDKTGKIWTSSWFKGGINLFNQKTKTFKNYLSGNSFWILYQDSDNVIWAGGKEGLYKYNPDKDNFSTWGSSNASNGFGLVKSLVEDNQKNLWIGTDDGIVMLNPERTESRLFGSNYGIKNKSLWWGSAYKDQKGIIYFGNETGYYQINPLIILKNIKPPKIVISGFNLFDEPIKQDQQGLLKKPLRDTKEIELGHNQNVFSFDFNILDFVNPDANRLMYYLENYDKDWIPANATKRAYYFNILPGKYVFHVKGMNSDGVWAEKKIDIIVLPPWYQSSWAYGIYAILFIVFIIAFNRFQRNRIIQRERQRAQERELAQAKEIEKAYTKLKTTQSQLIQSEKMASLGELTAGIAHEIQNPLNFVNNFSEVNNELIAELKEELLKENYEEVTVLANNIADNEEKINFHGKRAESIVKGMLQHSRIGNNVKEPTDINKLADEYLRLAYHGLRAKDKSFNADLVTDFDENLPKINVFPEEIGRVLLNLFTNAFYATHQKQKKSGEAYKPMVSVKTVLKDKSIELTVRDNGLGIPEAIKDKIMQPFFTTKPTGEGTGLGLSLSYDIVVKAHNGKITIDSVENDYTIFTILLPLE